MPQSENPNSTFMEYFKYRKNFCESISGNTAGKSLVRLIKPMPAIIMKDDVTSLYHFADNNKSIWEFIETHVPKGKRVLVGVCENDGLTTGERRFNPQMFDQSGNYMMGIGTPVSTCFGRNNPAKICESGVCHIIGHTMFEKYQGRLKYFISGGYGDATTIFYDL